MQLLQQWAVAEGDRLQSRITIDLWSHRYADDMELEDAIHTALLTLKEGFEGQIAADNIEVLTRWTCISQRCAHPTVLLLPVWHGWR